MTKFIHSIYVRPQAKARYDRIVSIARQTNPFYKEWIQDPEHVPVLDRRTFLDNNDRILNGHEAEETTSGSTGIPVRMAYSPEHRKAQEADARLALEWIGGPLDVCRICYVRDYHPPESTLDIQAPLDVQVAFIRHRYEVAWTIAFNTYPTNGVRLAQYVLENGIDMSFVKRIGLNSEQLDLWQREIIQQAFPEAQLWSNYSSMEFGFIGSQCPHESTFTHLMAHKLRIEVLDEKGIECPDGVPGRIVITDYFNTYSPFIRYEIGDLATKGTCPCGKVDLPAFAQIHGKVRGTLVKRDGSRLFFTDLSVALRDLPGMIQYQVVQAGVDEFLVKVVVAENSPIPEEGIRRVMTEHLGYLPDSLKIEPTSEIPRGKNGKFYASVCHVD